MTDRNKYEKLDDVGLVGLQDKKSTASRKYHQAKTGEVFRRARVAKKRSSAKSIG
jgi:hypothetical protein